MRRTKLRITLLALLGAIIATALGVTIWSNASITVNASKSDPAVVLANEIGDGDINYSEGYVGVRGTRIHYVTAGEGEPIIFVHGFPSYWFTMFGLMEAFKSDYQVIAIDGLGTGRSDAPSEVEAYEIKNLIQAINLVVSELELEHVHLVGHDWGVALTVGYAQANPDKVNTVTAMSALPHNIVLSRVSNDAKHRELFSYTDQFARANPFLIFALGIKDELFQSIYQPFTDRGLLSAEQADRLYKDIGNPRRLNRFIHWYRANFPNPDEIEESDFWPERAARLTVPAVFIYGSEDPVVTDPLVADFVALSDTLEVIVFEGVGHRPHFERRDDVEVIIRSLIENLE